MSRRSRARRVSVSPRIPSLSLSSGEAPQPCVLCEHAAGRKEGGASIVCESGFTGRQQGAWVGTTKERESGVAGEAERARAVTRAVRCRCVVTHMHMCTHVHVVSRASRRKRGAACASASVICMCGHDRPVRTGPRQRRVGVGVRRGGHQDSASGRDERTGARRWSWLWTCGAASLAAGRGLGVRAAWRAASSPLYCSHRSQKNTRERQREPPSQIFVLIHAHIPRCRPAALGNGRRGATRRAATCARQRSSRACPCFAECIQ